ncbi:MAG: hypothetical protein CMP10_14465 [Zetaproteobacteria bacterium]|nr:hypothetical protein [Pseudobdellovibrionaceae bacterium]
MPKLAELNLDARRHVMNKSIVQLVKMIEKLELEEKSLETRMKRSSIDSHRELTEEYNRIVLKKEKYTDQFFVESLNLRLDARSV